VEDSSPCIAAPKNRRHERYRLAAWATLTTILSRGLSVCLIVLGVHLAAGYLGATRFGVWATFASMTAMLSLLDLGVGNALVNRVAHAIANDDPNVVTRTITGGSGLLAVLGLMMALALLIPSLLLPWGALLKIGDPIWNQHPQLWASSHFSWSAESV
jgi:O-antigen/teichoic acid export membrane protein